MKTVAIYGFSERTRHYIKDSQAEDVWTLNNAYDYEVPIERVTRWYELHSTTLFGEISAERKKWLRRKHPFPVYMHKRYKSFPSSVKFPIDEIIAFVGRRYFSNTIAYMIAHAAFEQVGRLEIYGVEMENGTEYAYQKDGTEYMIRLAESAGVEIHLPPTSSLLNEQLYGYDGYTQLLPVDVLNEHIKHYSKCFDQMAAVYLPLVERHKSGDKEAIKEIMKMNPMMWLYDGARSYLGSLANDAKGHGVVKRQQLERNRIKLMNLLTGMNAQMNYLKGSINKEYDHAESKELEDVAVKMYNYDGAVQAVNRLIRHIDGAYYDMELKPSAVEN